MQPRHDRNQLLQPRPPEPAPPQPPPRPQRPLPGLDRPRARASHVLQQDRADLAGAVRWVSPNRPPRVKRPAACLALCMGPSRASFPTQTLNLRSLYPHLLLRSRRHGGRRAAPAAGPERGRAGPERGVCHGRRLGAGPVGGAGHLRRQHPGAGLGRGGCGARSRSRCAPPDCAKLTTAARGARARARVAHVAHVHHTYLYLNCSARPPPLRPPLYPSSGAFRPPHRASPQRRAAARPRLWARWAAVEQGGWVATNM
jgi:hypothetical protein